MMSGSIVIGSRESERVVVEPLCRGHDQGLVAQVSVDCGVWTGTFACEFHQGSLSEFAEHLQALLNCPAESARLDAALEAFHLNVTSDGSGSIRVEGLAKPGR